MTIIGTLTRNLIINLSLRSSDPILHMGCLKDEVS